MKTNNADGSSWPPTAFKELVDHNQLQRIISFLAPAEAAKFAQTSKQNKKYTEDFRYPQAQQTVI